MVLSHVVDLLLVLGQAQVGGDHRLRARITAQAPLERGPSPKKSSQYSNILPSAAQHAKRFYQKRHNELGGGTIGSEGYGEATVTVRSLLQCCATACDISDDPLAMLLF